jgi:hypothetical protein
LAWGLCFGSVTGRCGHAPSPKLRPKPKILAPHRHILYVDALVLRCCARGRTPPAAKRSWRTVFCTGMFAHVTWQTGPAAQSPELRGIPRAEHFAGVVEDVSKGAGTMEKSRTPVNRAFRGGIVGKSVHFLSKSGKKRLAGKGALWGRKNIYFFEDF